MEHQIAKKYTDSFDTILWAYEKIGERIPLLAEYQDIFKDNASLQEVLAKMFADILEFHQGAMKIYSGKGARPPKLVDA